MVIKTFLNFWITFHSKTSICRFCLFLCEKRESSVMWYQNIWYVIYSIFIIFKVHLRNLNMEIKWSAYCFYNNLRVPIFWADQCILRYDHHVFKFIQIRRKKKSKNKTVFHHSQSKKRQISFLKRLKDLLGNKFLSNKIKLSATFF